MLAGVGSSATCSYWDRGWLKKDDGEEGSCRNAFKKLQNLVSDECKQISSAAPGMLLRQAFEIQP